MNRDLNRQIPEMHSDNVDRLTAVVKLAARKHGIQLLDYKQVSALSPRAYPIASVEPVKNRLAFQIVHLPFHFALVVLTGTQLLQWNVEGSDGTAAVYVDSIHGQLEKPEVYPASSVNSPIVEDLLQGTSGKLLDVQGIQQPPGRSCGMASYINAAVFLALETHSKIIEEGVTSILQKFDLPAKDSWANPDFVSASRVLISCYLEGPDSVPELPRLLTDISFAIKKSRAISKQTRKRHKQQKQRTQQLNGTQSTLIKFLTRVKSPGNSVRK